MSKKATKKKKVIYNLLICICAVIFFFSAYQLLSHYLEYKKMDAVYANINDAVFGKIDIEINDEGLLNVIPPVDMDELKAINPEIVGYILIPNTRISYPIVYSEERLKYLSINVESNPSRSGAIFIDSNNAADFSDDNTIIYGHNMADDSMFGTLSNYLDDPDYFNQHAYIYIYTPNGVQLYRIFSSQLIDVSSDIYTTLHFTSQEEQFDFIKTQAQNSSISPKKMPDEAKDIVMLSTCHSGTNGVGRTVIFAYLVETLPLP